MFTAFDARNDFPHTLIVIMFKKRTNAKAYAAAKKEFKASASKASTSKADTKTESFLKDPSTPGDSTKTNPAFLDSNTALPAFEMVCFLLFYY